MTRDKNNLPAADSLETVELKNSENDRLDEGDVPGKPFAFDLAKGGKVKSQAEVNRDTVLVPITEVTDVEY